MLESEETSKGGPLAAVDGLLRLLSRCVTSEQSANGPGSVSDHKYHGILHSKRKIRGKLPDSCYP